ncbi:MAG: hypothetical protein J7598_08345 [Mitsuaria chitosanitabida]|uniref:hypothetical protein n=1 Tax=Roseateles chitosanitabidus TaxID=65048 RepID=UPI001B191547|nr:hypothetical protein [Roseateles chitosanitabidus]MBO9686608.1 hypothetical protein [Roseateles chitosanitabidus]
MADIKQLRQIAAQQALAQMPSGSRRPEELDEAQQPEPAQEAASMPESSGPFELDSDTLPSASAEASTSKGGLSPAAIGAGALGLLAVAAAAGGGGGGKSGDLKPPMAEMPKPQPESPKAEEPRPEEQKPQPSTPSPEPQAPSPEVSKPEAEAPGTSSEPQQPSPDPTVPTAPDPEQPGPAEPEPFGLQLAIDSGRSDSDRLTRDGTIRVNGLVPGTAWFFSLDGAGWLPGSGREISAAQVGGANGDRFIRVKQSTSGGTELLQEIRFQLDTVALPAPGVWLTNLTTHLDPDAGFVINLAADVRWYFSEDLGATWQVGGDTREGIWWGAPPSILSGSDGERTVLFRQEDRAGNFSEATAFKFTLDRAGIPDVSLKVDTGSDTTDGITNDGTLTVGNVAKSSTWKYSVDGGATWKVGGADHQIAGSEFGSTPGHKTAQVVRIGANGKESERATFEFTLQFEEIHGSPSVDSKGPTTFTGTDGLDRFVVKSGDGKGIHIAGYQQGDVVDLTQVLTIPAGAEVSKYISGSDAAGHHLINVDPGGALVSPSAVTAIEVLNFVAGTPVTILYNGGQVVI